MTAPRSPGRRFAHTHCTRLFAAVLTFAGTSRALAQQPPPVVPATGEPPPLARAQEEAEIANQAREAYAQAHQDELKREAERQVEQERRAAWEQRGRENIPPAFTTHPPRPTFDVLGSVGSAATKGWGLGLTGVFDMRLGRSWGLQAAGSYLTLRTDDAAFANPILRAGACEVSGYLAIVSGKSKQYVNAERIVLRTGNQLVVPAFAPNLPPAYFGPFAAFGGVMPVGRLGKGYFAFVWELRFGYRFALGPGDDSIIKGFFSDLFVGPGVGF